MKAHLIHVLALLLAILLAILVALPIWAYLGPFAGSIWSALCFSLGTIYGLLARPLCGKPIAWLRTEGLGSPVVTADYLEKFPQERSMFGVPLYMR